MTYTRGGGVKGPCDELLFFLRKVFLMWVSGGGGGAQAAIPPPGTYKPWPGPGPLLVPPCSRACLSLDALIAPFTPPPQPRVRRIPPGLCHARA